MNGPTAAVVIFFLLMCVKCLLLSLTPFLWYDTHTHTHTHTHAHTHTHTDTHTHTQHDSAPCWWGPTRPKQLSKVRVLLEVWSLLTNTHTHTHTHTHTNTHTHSCRCTRVASAMCRTWVNDFQRHAWECLLSCISSLFSQVNWLLRFLTVRPWDPLSSLEPLPVLIKVPKQEGLAMY